MMEWKTCSGRRRVVSQHWSVCVSQVGLVSVALCAPTLEGTYTSHWRLAHGGEQFGPRVWCSIVVDPDAPTAISADCLLVSPCVTPQVSTLTSTPPSSVSHHNVILPVCESQTTAKYVNFYQKQGITITTKVSLESRVPKLCAAVV